MAINTITYSNKSDINTTATPAVNKVSASDMNEIKSVVNSNANVVGDPANLPTTASNIVDAISEVNSKIDNYSTTETVCGTWIDGKPLYKVVVETTTPSATGSWKEIYTNHNVNKIISYGGYYSSSATLSFAVPLNTNDRNFWFSVNSSNNIQMAVDSSSDLNKNITLWFEYTKTTD